VRAVLLIRSEAALTDPSADRQIAAAHALAAQQGWEVSDDDMVFVPVLPSGIVTEHPSFTALLEDADRGRVTTVIVETTDRIARRDAETVAMVHDLRRRGVAVWSSSTGSATTDDTPTGRFLRAAYDICAELTRNPAKAHDCGVAVMGDPARHLAAGV
jgi:DNA invertase Pin-like site-specific DNA recombinase